MPQPSASWRKTFRDALAILKDIKNGIAEITLQIINEKKVRILSPEQITKTDFEVIRPDFIDQKKGYLPARYPLSKSSVKKLSKAWEGFIYEDRIYIPNGLSPRKFAKTLVHEINHFLNGSIDHYEKNDDKFREELRAHLAEQMVFNKAITRQKLKQVAQKVIDVNPHIQMPKQWRAPGGVYANYPVTHKRVTF